MLVSTKVLECKQSTNHSLVKASMERLCAQGVELQRTVQLPPPPSPLTPFFSSPLLLLPPPLPVSSSSSLLIFPLPPSPSSFSLLLSLPSSSLFSSSLFSSSLSPPHPTPSPLPLPLPSSCSSSSSMKKGSILIDNIRFLLLCDLGQVHHENNSASKNAPVEGIFHFFSF